MKASELLNKARRAPANVRFSELCRIAEDLGWTLKGIRGSHFVFVRENERAIMTFQNVKGYAKPYQVRQLLAWVDDQARQS